ncbi:hypothetical protein ABMA27_002225 [Loxostege sticticalis]|uniref:Leucine-rich PPR motif-containing protein, mitochondrial n=1 Tax=Loxostege sticticalis TaxID=481309 RepID=A0ABR3HXA2_LOXSC
MSSLLRSTKFVRYFTGAARTLILNTAKTTEVSTLINPKALTSANNVLMRDYATSKKAESLEPLLQRLDSEVRRFGRITKRDIDEVFDELKGKNNITSSQSLLVIRCCGELVPEELPEQRTLLVQKIWNILTERGIPMDISHYNALLRVYIENEHPFSPAQFLEELENKGIQPNRVTYQRLMWRYCQEGDVEGATKVLEKMRELNFPVSEPVLNALVMGHAFHGDTDGAKAVLETMAGAGLQPTNHTYTLLACGYAKKGDIDGVKEIIKLANEKDAYITDKDVLDIIEQLSLGGHGDKVDHLFGYLEKNVGYNQDVCNLVLKLLNKGQIETAKAVMKTMPKSTTIDDTKFKGAFFVKQLLRINVDSEKIIQICKEVQQENLVPSALYIATETALQLGKTELAQKLFKEMQKEGMEIRQHYYWPLLAQKGKEGDEEGMLQILRTMTAEGLAPTGETLRDYVIPYLLRKDNPQNVILKLQIANVPTISAARNLMMELLDAGKIKEAADITLQFRLRVQYPSLARPLLGALGKTKDIDSFVTILHVVSSSQQSNQADEENSTEDSQADERAGVNEVGRIVKSAIKMLAKPELAEKLLTALHSKGLSISTESAEEIQQFLDKNLTTTISELLTKLTSVDLEPVSIESSRRATGPRTPLQLEKLIEQIKSKDADSNVARLQKQLLMAYIKENNVPKVKSYLEELKASNFALSSAMLAQLYEFYCQNDEIEKAKKCQAQLAEQAPEFELNKYKLILMVNALIKANRYDEALQFLKDNKPKGDNENFFLLSSKCWQMLNTLAEQKEDAKVLELTKALIDNNYVEASNVILGPSIKAFLLKNNVEGALTQFELCCNQYRCTPWKGELMKTLIMKEDATKLQWLADLSTQIHGEVNILHDLVLAFVECGRLRQARRILETPGMHTRQRRLDDACQRYVEEGKSEYLEGLLEATKELSHIDRSNIFYHLLVTYCKADETDKAVGLWTILQEEGEVPSNQFLAYLGKHLKSKNREVPFVMPEELKPEQPKKQKVQPPLQNLPTKSQISEKIETLIKEGQAVKAMDIALKTIEKGTMPKTAVLKYLLKTLAEGGHVEKIQQLGKHLSDAARRRLTYDDKLTLAVFNQGAGAKHIDSMVEEVQSAATIEDFEAILKKFPRSNALASIVNNETLVAKCQKVAELAAAKGQFTPVNLLWMEYLLAGKEKEANEIWKQWLCKAPSILFRRLLQESHTSNNIKMVETLLETMKTNSSLTKGSFGNVYSRLINLYLTNNKLKEAESALQKAIEEGVQLEHFNKNCIERLKTVMKDSGKEFNYFN